MERGRIQRLPNFFAQIFCVVGGTPYYLGNGQSYGLQIL